MYRWVNPGEARYYHDHPDRDLFGGWTLTLVLGGTGSRRGDMQVTQLKSYEDGPTRLQAVDSCRQHRGYRPVAWHSAPSLA